MSDTIAWFGKHKDKELSEIPGGYLRWMTENFDAKPLPKDTKGMSIEEIDAMEARMVAFLSAAADELERREHHDQS